MRIAYAGSIMMITEHQLEVTVKAPFFTLNELTEATTHIWVAFHGYGQLAKFFLKKFEHLDSARHFVIAPQGLSKYYTEGFTGRVGASWMTKEDRLTEIDNQYTYIQEVLGQFQEVSKKKLIYFGFSQGTATMGRFAARAKLPFEKMIIWAGTFPPDIEADGFDFLRGDEEIIYYTSKEDPFFKEEMIENQNKVVSKSIGKPPTLKWYDGGHTVIANLVPKILKS